MALNDIPQAADNLGKLVEEIKSKQRKYSVHLADVSSDEQVRVMVENVVKEHGSLDVVSNSWLSESD